MQFTTTIIALFAATALAAPSYVSERDVAAINSLQAQAQSFLDAKEASGCSKLKCIAALAPTVVSCATALAQGGLDPISDVACLATLTNSSVNRPKSCTGC